MKTRTVFIIARDNGERTTAELLICPECEARIFLCYMPAGVDHAHFQCVHCQVTFCEGCTKDDPLNPASAPATATKGGG